MNKFKNILWLVAIFNSVILQAQKWRDFDTSVFIIIDSSSSFFKVKNPEVNTLEKTLLAVNSFYGSSNKNSYQIFRENADNLGYTHKKYQRLFNNVPVEGHTFIVHCNEQGLPQIVNGFFTADIVDEEVIKINQEQANARAIDVVPTNQLHLKNADEQSEGNTPMNIGLRYIKLNEEKDYVLTYPILTINTETGNSEILFISASTGLLVRREESIDVWHPQNSSNHKKNTHVEANQQKQSDGFENTQRCMSCTGNCLNGTGHTTLYGSQFIKVGKIQNGLFCRHRLLQSCDNVLIETKNRPLNINSPFDWINTTPSPLFITSNDEPGVQIHWGVEKTVEFFRNTFNFNSMNGAGNSILSIFDGNFFDNATFDRTSFELRFGVPSTNTGVANTNLNDLSTIGHEFVHGISKFEIGGNTPGASWNTTGEPAALNESFSDILGGMAEFYVKSNYSTGTSFSYSHGIESLTNTFFSLGPCNNVSFLASNIRNMADPNATGHPDTYLQNNLWIPTACTTVDNGGQHTNAQVQNHWFFILAEGETGINANNDAYCVPGIGKTKATAITFRNLTVFMNANSDYAAARAGSIQSAIDLFGANSDEVAQVTQAWFAVGVGARYLGTIDVKNITVTNTQNFNRNCRIEVQNFTNQGASSNVTITSNTEIAFLASASTDVSINNSSTLSAFITPTCNGNSAFVANNNQPVERDTKSTKEESRKVNPVLESNEDLIESKISNPSFNVVPNPTTGIFTLMLDNNLITPELIVVSNTLGGVVFEKEIFSNGETEFDLSGSPNGIYFIKVINKGGTYSTKKLVKF